jgi:hypothetical protein
MRPRRPSPATVLSALAILALAAAGCGSAQTTTEARKEGASKAAGLATQITGPGAALYTQAGVEQRARALFEPLSIEAKKGALESFKVMYETLERQGKVAPHTAFAHFLDTVKSP